MRTDRSTAIHSAWVFLFILAAATCSAFGASFTIGGSVTGLKTGGSVTLLDGKASVKVTANGVFTFAAAFPSGTKYDITISKQPSGETCTVANASGKVAASNIKNVDVTCGHTIGGTATGLKGGDSVVLEDNGGNLLTVAAPGKSASTTVKFTFTTAVLVGDKYDVTIKTQPKGQTCIVQKPSGTVGSSNVATVEVTCGYTIGGAVAGLKTGDSVTLEDKSGDELKLTGNVKFVFKTPVASGSAYSVKVLTLPKGETCSIAHGSGTVASANVTNILVTCAAPTFSISGAVSGLSSTATSITLKNGSATQTVTYPKTSFSFTGIPSGSAYAVTVVTPPTGETCAVSSNGSGSSITANITGVTVTCTAPTFSISGAVSGLSSTATSITLKNGSATQTITFPSTSFSFTGIPSGSAYGVTVVTPPTGETCSVSSNGSGSSITANITGVTVTCTTSGGGGGGAAYWIPYVLLPVPDATPAGSNGLFLVPSDKLATNPTPQSITTDPVKSIGVGVNVSSSDGVVTYSPQLLMYADTSTSKDGTTQTTQIYGITLAGTSTVPTPVQIGSFSLVSTTASPQMICGAISFETDQTNPESLFAVIETSDTIEDCYDDKNALFQVVHYQDSPSTAPVTVSINTTAIFSLYQSGMLTGLLLFDSTNNSLDVYADDTFTSPKQLITGISGASYEGGSANGADDSTAENFFQVATVATKSTPSANYLYRIDGSTQAASQIQDLGAGSITGVATDDTNLYYIDFTSSKADNTITDEIYQVALTGGTPVSLYTAPAISTVQFSPVITYSLIGSNDSVLAFEFNSEPDTNMAPDPTKETAAFYSVPIGKTTTTPTTLASYLAGNSIIGAFLAAPSGSGASGNVLFGTVSNASGSQSTPVIALSAVSMPLDGGSAAKPIANSVYESLEGISNSGKFTNRVWQVTGITDTNGGWGGGTANIVDVGTLADTPFTTVGGKDYIFTTGFGGVLSAISSNNIAAGTFSNSPLFDSGSAASLLENAAAADLTSNFLWTGPAVTNTIVLPY
jgi:hypothetical protein